MNGDITLGFNNLTPAEAIRMAEFYQSMKSGHAPTVEEISAALPLPPSVAAPPAPPTVATTANTAAPLPPQPVTAPNAVPSTGPSDATVNAGMIKDKRGVPWNRKYHSGEPGSENMSDKGAWRGRKGTSQSPLAEEKAAYEAQFMGNGAGSAAASSPAAAPSLSPIMPITGTAPTAHDAPNAAPLAPPAVIAAVSAPPPGTPSMVDFMALWHDLTVTRQLIGPEWLAWVMGIGGHPMAPEAQYAADPEKRLTVYNALRDFQLKHAA